MYPGFHQKKGGLRGIASVAIATPPRWPIPGRLKGGPQSQSQMRRSHSGVRLILGR